MSYHDSTGITITTDGDGRQNVIIGQDTSPKIRREANWVYRILPSALSDPILDEMIEKVEIYHALKYK